MVRSIVSATALKTRRNRFGEVAPLHLVTDARKDCPNVKEGTSSQFGSSPCCRRLLYTEICTAFAAASATGASVIRGAGPRARGRPFLFLNGS